MKLLIPSSGTGKFIEESKKVIRFVRFGCSNRPFYHIVVAEKKKEQHEEVIEQVGTYDPMINQYNEKLVALNFERIRFWIGKGADISLPVSQLLGLSGFYPIHPRSIMTAWRNRRKIEEENEKRKNEIENQT